ncbi:flavin reductase family protein [Streptomyces clavuligerus]|nr:flavin reductase family protein [Streptomyces clavuligerus]ANW18801.1 NADPH-flavin oxidoreductase [Streptomyces clavuligerus]AXU13371.1 flavin reductase [Streptomyces clavuligerus]MBY6303327.1 flavin reductase family protein [Streptomyces clavuligerus]QCS06154.1 flavin reductase [Streptomyces clavuligerus]QPJ96765.1 flavin reductase [Streptomyces clavuligerus]
MAETAIRYLRSAASQAAATGAGGDAAAGDGEAAVPGPRARLRAVGVDERAPGAAGQPPADIDAGEFRRVLGGFPSGVTVITAHTPDDPAGPAGFACQSFSALSLDPPLVVFMVGRTSSTWPRIARAGGFCVNVLNEDQGALCRGFAVSGADGRDKFAGVAHRPAPVTGSPLLTGAQAWLDCRVHAVHPGGDHLIVVGRVLGLGAADDGAGEPLVFHRGAFRRLARPQP